jgi:hypothetical protein
MSAQSAKVIDLTEVRLARAAAARVETPCMTVPPVMPSVVWVPIWTYVPAFSLGR